MTTATFYTVQDATLWDGFMNQVADAVATTVQAWYRVDATYGDSYARIGLKVDLSSLTAAQIATAVSFSYQVQTASTSRFNLRKITSWWEEVNATGTEPSIGDDPTDTLLTATPTGTYSYSHAKLLDWVNAWIDGSSPNYGWAISPKSSGDVDSFFIYAREQTGTTSDPYLSVTYTGKPVISNVNIAGGVSVPATGNVQPAFSFSDPDGDTLTQVAIRRKRLTGA